MNPSLVGKGALPHKGALIQWRHIGNLAHVAGKLGELLEALLGNARIVHFQLEVSNNGNQVHVSTPLSISIDCALYHLSPCLDCRQRIGQGEPAVVVGVNPYGDFQKGCHRSHNPLNLQGHTSAVGVAKDNGIRASFLGSL